MTAMLRVLRVAGATLRRLRRRLQGDEGSAIVEFLGVALVLLVPLIYLVLVLGRVQAAAFAVDGAAREAVRAVTSAATLDSPTGGDLPAGARAVAAVGIALGDQGISADPVTSLDLVCGGGCVAPGSSVSATVQVDVGLPFVPGFLRSAVPLSIPVSAHADGHIERFAQARP